MGQEEAYIPGIVTATVLALVATAGYQAMPSANQITWLGLFGVSLLTFFSSIKSPSREIDRD